MVAMVAEHTITMKGPRVSGGQPSPEPAGTVLRLVEPIVRGSVSMGFRHASAMRGRRPDWLTAASDIRFVRISRGEADATVLHFIAPHFGEAAREVYRQREFFSFRPDGNDTGFDLLGDAFLDIGNQKKDSDKFDSALLRHIKSLGSIPGVEAVTLGGNRLPKDPPVVLDRSVADMAAALYHETPRPSRARIAGKLDMIRDSDNVFAMILDDRTEVRGIWVGGDMGSLTRFFGKRVLAEGQAVFRPSGSLLRLEAEAMDVAGAESSFFSKLPMPVTAGGLADRVRETQSPQTGAAAIFGRWPGEESEEELLAALEDLRK